MANTSIFSFVPVPSPDWDTAAAPAARCLAQIDTWTGSEPLRALVHHYGGQLPVDAAERLPYLEEFSREHWDFRRGRERNLVEEPSATAETVAIVSAVGEALGLASGNPPLRNDYDAILVLGGLIRACLIRPEYAAALVSSGITTREVVALGGFRRLAGDELPIAERFELHENPDEFWAMSAGMELAFGPLPTVIETGHHDKNMNASWLLHTYERESGPRLRVVAAPSSSPGERRANSRDTYVFWAKQVAELPPNPHVLLVTTSIYVPYQGCAAIEALGIEHGIGVETVGTAMTSRLFPGDEQQFLWHHYLQEIRSAIRGVHALQKRLASAG